MKGKFLWIWDFNQCDGGNLSKILKKANNFNLTGFIVKAHDGSNVWSQAQYIQRLKSYGLVCGAWGYCYGNNIKGEINAVKSLIKYHPDFYVADVESEYETTAKRQAAETFMKFIQNLGFIIGYTSFALPYYHNTFPFDIFSKYSSFTMPQIYWKTMNLSVDDAFRGSIQQYKKYGKPIYPVGQAYDNASMEEIQEFDRLCKVIDSPVISYWDYQHASNNQLQAIKGSVFMLQKGDIGSEVVKLQNELNNLGYNLVIDGIFGDKTEAAVMNFQSKNKLAADGIVGPLTQQRLIQCLNKKIVKQTTNESSDLNNITEPKNVTQDGVEINDTYYEIVFKNRNQAQSLAQAICATVKEVKK